jgi:Fur family ferric uptake transcriptional regulator
MSIQPRNTRQKTALRQAFEKAARPLSPEEALELASHEVSGIGLATVYRNIKSLVEEGFLTTVELVNEPPRYEIAGKDHHHHFRCNKCHKVYELEGCLHNVESIVPKGFKVSVHHILFYGTCESCG